MSTAVPFAATCPACGHAFDTRVWRSLHVRRAPEVRAELLEGRFGVHDCPDCGAAVRIEPTVLYTDFDRKQWYALFPRWALVHRGDIARQVEDGFQVNMVERAAPIAREWAPDFTIRTVFGVPSLREKVLAAEHGIDDRVLELHKVQLIRDVLTVRLHPELEFHLHSISAEQLVFDIEGIPGEDGTSATRRVGVPRSGYMALAAAPDLAERFPDFFTGSVVDWRAPLLPDVPIGAAA